MLRGKESDAASDQLAPRYASPPEPRLSLPSRCRWRTDVELGNNLLGIIAA